jgi:MFS family permease
MMYKSANQKAVSLNLHRYIKADTPESVGQHPDGDEAEAGGAGGEAEAQQEERSFTVGEARQTRTFWLLLFCNFERAAVYTAVTWALLDIVREAGVGEEEGAARLSALLLSVSSLVGLPVGLCFGFVAERVPLRLLLASTFLTQCVTLVAVAHVRSAVAAVLAGVVWGFGAAADNIVLSVAWPSFFGRAHIGALLGTSQTFMVVGSSLGPVLYAYGARVVPYRTLLFATIPWAASCAVAGALAVAPPPPPPPRAANELERRETEEGIRETDSLLSDSKG